MTKIHLVGTMPDAAWLPPAIKKLAADADVLAGGERLMGLFPDFEGRKLPIRAPLSGWLSELKRASEGGQKVLALASGDPNFFGLAKKFLTVMPPDDVTVIPAPSTVQEAFARLKTSWEGVRVVSLHGREGMRDFWPALFRAGRQGNGYLAVYTDPQNTPAIIAQRVLDRGFTNYRMYVFENLGEPDERVTSHSLQEACAQKFSPLNLAVLQCVTRPLHIAFGQSEDLYLHEAGLITKGEVRAVALGQLELLPHHSLWDLGAGSGSVSIEAASILSYGSVWAVEKSPERAEQIFKNRIAFGAAHLEIVQGGALEVMDGLPEPDRVFLGGGGDELAEIIMAARARLRPDGVIVASVVSLASLASATLALTNQGREPDVVQVQISRATPLASSSYFKALNQVWLVKGRF